MVAAFITTAIPVGLKLSITFYSGYAYKVILLVKFILYKLINYY